MSGESREVSMIANDGADGRRELREEKHVQVVDVRGLAMRLSDNVEQVIVGKHQEVQMTLMALLCQGRVLVEDVPGVGKTMLAKAIARSLGCTFKRVQLTPDLPPTDVTGGSTYTQKTGEL